MGATHYDPEDPYHEHYGDGEHNNDEGHYVEVGPTLATWAIIVIVVAIIAFIIIVGLIIFCVCFAGKKILNRHK